MDTMQNPGEVPQNETPVTPEVVPTSEAVQASVTPEAPKAEEMPKDETPHAPQENAPSGAATERRGMAALSYIGVLCLIPLLFAKESAFAQYHAKQGIVLVGVWIALRILGEVLWGVPFGGALVSLASIALFVVCILGIVKALSGEKFEIAYVSEWAEKIHF